MVLLRAMVFCAVCLLIPVSSVYAKDKNSRHGIYVGTVVLPFETSGLEDIHASDWQNYGLLSTNPFSLEGRVSLPLTKGETSGLHPGVVLGFEEEIDDFPPISVEIQYAPASGASIIGFFLGVNFKLLRQEEYDIEKFSLGILPKIGYVLGKIDFGAVELLPGYTPPVITPEGTFYVGDPISANFSGGAFQGTLFCSYSLSEKISVSGQIGYVQAFLKDLLISAGDVDLDMDSPVLVNKDLSSMQAGIDPKAEMKGPVAALALTYRF